MIHFICAFHSEAKPVIEHYGLHHVNIHKAFQIYVDRENSISLTISGKGKLASAAATAYTYAVFQSSKADVWVNIGIAGHGQANIGELFLAHSICDKGNHEYWYPQIIFNPDCKTTECITVDKPGNNYQNNLIDMEASGFYSSCLRVANTELIHVIKIVSDNNTQQMKMIDETLAYNLIKQNISSIANIVRTLNKLAVEYATTFEKPENLTLFTEHWHFSRTQTITLEKQLRRWQILRPDEDPFPIFKHFNDSENLIMKLINVLDETIFEYD